MELKAGQMVIMLSPYAEGDIYGNIASVAQEHIVMEIKNNWMVKSNWDIACLVIDQTEMYEFYSVVKHVEGKMVIIEKPVFAGLSSVEKRRFNRVACDIGFIGRPVQLNNKSIAGSLNKVFKGSVKNLGANGILAETNLLLPEGLIFNTKIKLDQFIDCDLVIRWSKRIGDESLCQFGCQFVNLPLDQVKSISLYAFKEQLKNRRKELSDRIIKKNMDM